MRLRDSAGFGLTVGGAALVAFGDPMRQRHVEPGDAQELVALAGIAQPLGRTHALQRLSSIRITPVTRISGVPQCVKF